MHEGADFDALCNQLVAVLGNFLMPRRKRNDSWSHEKKQLLRGLSLRSRDQYWIAAGNPRLVVGSVREPEKSK